MGANKDMTRKGTSAAERPGLFKRMAEDVRAAVERDPAAPNAFVVLTSYPGVHAIWAHRAEHWLWKHGFKWLARFGSQITRFVTGIEIHPGADLGRRLFIDHGMGIVIGETAVVGDDVTLYHGVTLGGTSLEKVKRHPTLQSCVVVGAGAKVLGDITVGSHSRIGANAVVVKDVPPQSVVVGVPGQIIRRRHLMDEHQTDLLHSEMPDAVVSNLKELMERLARIEARLEIHSDQLSQIELNSEGVWEYSDSQDYVICWLKRLGEHSARLIVSIKSLCLVLFRFPFVDQDFAIDSRKHDQHHHAAENRDAVNVDHRGWNLFGSERVLPQRFGRPGGCGC